MALGYCAPSGAWVSSGYWHPEVPPCSQVQAPLFHSIQLMLQLCVLSAPQDSSRNTNGESLGFIFGLSKEDLPMP